MTQLLRTARRYGHVFRPGFTDWIKANGPIFDRFETTALKLWKRGRGHYSARRIIEGLRHESALSETESAYKLNNDFTPDLARLFLIRHPECEGFFALRGRPAR